MSEDLKQEENLSNNTQPNKSNNIKPLHEKLSDEDKPKRRSEEHTSELQSH